jgi:hypothetical protein
MANKITRFNLHTLSPYEQAAWRKERRAEAYAMQQNAAALAEGFAAIRTNHAVQTGDLISRAAMDRMAAQTRQRLSKLV